ncbi:hypothetical protein LguiB_009661 [Lonicera macranthoides]
MAGNTRDDEDSGFRQSLEPQEGDYANFELSELLELDDWIEEEPTLMISGYPQQPISAGSEAGSSSGNSGSHLQGPNTGNGGNGGDRSQTRVAFKTESAIEILEDGYRWRKYGKKRVKNSPHPRNYFRCSVEGCPVKKRVEREREDPSDRNVTTLVLSAGCSMCPGVAASVSRLDTMDMHHPT